MTGEKSLAYKLIDRRIDDYIAYRIAKAKKNTKQEKVERRSNNNAAQADAIQ